MALHLHAPPRGWMAGNSSMLPPVEAPKRQSVVEPRNWFVWPCIETTPTSNDAHHHLSGASHPCIHLNLFQLQATLDAACPRPINSRWLHPAFVPPVPFTPDCHQTSSMSCDLFSLT
ncbi:unnamed protein product [Periconia digitata]|uniref:Uncharacterized protein n=1 Tax=Periconia digitata TaxID=1303443 RepID=A0A9W4UTR6_9PLEO|nr:unnamed protein product [Periconia digitata]